MLKRHLRNLLTYFSYRTANTTSKGVNSLAVAKSMRLTDSVS